MEPHSFHHRAGPLYKHLLLGVGHLGILGAGRLTWIRASNFYHWIISPHSFTSLGWGGEEEGGGRERERERASLSPEAHIWRLEESVLFFYHVGLTVIRLGCQPLYSLNHFTGPELNALFTHSFNKNWPGADTSLGDRDRQSLWLSSNLISMWYREAR